MSTDERQQETLGHVGEAVAAARSEAEATTTPTDGKPGALPAAPEKAWEAPGWAKRWQEPSRKALEQLYAVEPARPHWNAIQKELDQTYGYVGKRDQEFADYRKRMDPLWEAVSPFEQRYALQGMNPAQGVQQLLQVADYLSSNPDQGIPWIGSQYRPQDPGAVIKALAQSWGFDLGAAAQEAPFIDSGIKSLFEPVAREVQAIKQQLGQQDMGAKQQQRVALLKHIEAFETATDESGSPKFPHFTRVWERMLALLNGKVSSSLEDAYEQAVTLDKELQAQIRVETEQKDAAARRAEAEKALAASKTVDGKAKPGPNEKRAKSISEAVKMARAESGD